MRHGGQGAGEEQSQAAADSGESARSTQNRDHAQYEKGADDGQQFELLKGYEAGNQDPRGNSSQGTE
jgi:hypothetical protein